MFRLFPKTLQESLPEPNEQEGNKNPTVYAVFQFPLSGWTWFVTEGDVYEEDICFFGYVVGLESEWGYFCLSELEAVDINGIKICRNEDHVPRLLAECLKHHGLDEN